MKRSYKNRNAIKATAINVASFANLQAENPTTVIDYETHYNSKQLS